MSGYEITFVSGERELLECDGGETRGIWTTFYKSEKITIETPATMPSKIGRLFGKQGKPATRQTQEKRTDITQIRTDHIVRITPYDTTAAPEKAGKTK